MSGSTLAGSDMQSLLYTSSPSSCRTLSSGSLHSANRAESGGLVGTGRCSHPSMSFKTWNSVLFPFDADHSPSFVSLVEEERTTDGTAFFHQRTQGHRHRTCQLSPLPRACLSKPAVWLQEKVIRMRGAEANFAPIPVSLPKSATLPRSSNFGSPRPFRVKVDPIHACRHRHSPVEAVLALWPGEQKGPVGGEMRHSDSSPSVNLW